MFGEKKTRDVRKEASKFYKSFVKSDHWIKEKTY
jgi:hypothetical protein